MIEGFRERAVATPIPCTPNIGPRERRKRMTFGASLIAVGLGAAASLLYSRSTWYWLALVFLPLWAGGLGVFQATGQT
jgi:hypothetical protein